MKKKVVKRVIALLAVSVLSVGVLAGCGNTAATDATSDNTVVTEETKEDTETVSDIVADTTEYKVVVIAGPGIDAEGNVSLLGNAAVARDQGYIEEELNAIGYTADYVGFQSAGVGANEALAAKEADIAIYGDFPAITYVAGGNEAKIIAGNTTRNQLGIFARDGINSVEDLKGKKVATMFGTTAYLYLSNQLNEAGLTIDDIEVVNATVDAISLYLTGEVDAIANSPQLYWGVTANGGQGNEVAINGDKEDLASYNVVIARTEFLDANPEVEKALVKALKRGYEWANAFISTISNRDIDSYSYLINETRTDEVLMNVRDYKSEIGVLAYSESNEKIINKLLREYDLEFHPLMVCDTYAYLSKTHPLADREELSLEELSDYPCVLFEQTNDAEFYLSEEALSGYEFKKILRSNDRATSCEMMAMLNGFAIGTGIMIESNALKDAFVSIKLKEEDPLTIGYIVKKNHLLSDFGKLYISELEKYETK